MPNNEIDPKILAQGKKGSFWALEKIIKAMEKPIYWHIFRFVQNQDDASDLTHETFIKLFKNIKNYDETKNFKAWLYKIATNTVYDYLRRKQKNNEFLILDEISELETNGQDHTYVLVGEEYGADLENALDKIEPHYKTTILLYYQQGFNYQEIAEILNIPINTVKTHLFRAKQALKKELTK